jgi:hypothetical protein
MRKTWHYDPEVGGLVEGPSPRKTDSDSGDAWRFSDRLYSDAPFVGKDGTVINSRAKHRAYMKRHNLTTVDDFKGEWDRSAEKRAGLFQGNHDKEARAHAIAKAMEKHRG